MIDKPLPPAVFGEEPTYVAIRKDVDDIRSPMTSAGLAQIHQNFPGVWTYLTIAEVLDCVFPKTMPPTTEDPKPVPPFDTALADTLRRLQISVISYADQVDTFTVALRKVVSET